MGAAMTVLTFTVHKQQDLGRRGPWPSTPLAAALALGFPSAFGILPAQAADETSAEIIAVQIRDQGYACDKALSAKREHPELDDAVWILKCDNGSYRVRLIPDLAAKVEPLD
jgi:hypothetical protein